MTKPRSDCSLPSPKLQILYFSYSDSIGKFLCMMQSVTFTPCLETNALPRSQTGLFASVNLTNRPLKANTVTLLTTSLKTDLYGM
jgi:hypothetical protein